MKEIFSYPNQTNYTRNFLGTKGEKNLLVVDLHPHPIVKDGLDKTAFYVDMIANYNGYDGWVLVSLYPKVVEFLYQIDKFPNESLAIENLELIEAFIHDKQFNIDTVWMAWGHGIEAKTYFLKYAYWLYDRLQKYDLKYVSIGTKQFGEPIHPVPLVLSQRNAQPAQNELPFRPFDFDYYVRRFKHLIRN